MRIEFDGTAYVTNYFPFSRKEDGWYLDLPSGESYFAFDEFGDEKAESLLAFHINAYILADDSTLTADAIKLKNDLRDMFDVIEYHPCFKCEESLELMNPMHPDSGISFYSHGNYGSTAFDPMDDTYLELLICDKCLTAHKKMIGGTGEIVE